MTTQPRLRQTCDLCYKRKLKCDREKPRCSNCITYGSTCSHTAPSRKWKAKSRPIVAAQTDSHEKHAGVETPRHTIPAQKPDQGVVYSHAQSTNSSSTGTRIERHLFSRRRDVSITLSLPPLEKTMMMVGYFLNHVNPVLPLFDGDVLLRQIGECYAQLPHQRDPTLWAAINIVLALSNQHMPQDLRSDDPLRVGPGSSVMQYADRAQTVLSEVLLAETTLLHVQTLVGMVMVLQTDHDVKPALMLISATMRLAHSLGLHSRVASAHLEPRERLQHNNVFWLAYILDKNLSLRSHQPSIQLDDDIGVDLPGSALSDIVDDASLSGIVSSTDASAQMNFLLARVQLANIEGAVYDSLYSTRASNRTKEERAAARDSVLTALETWESAVPPPFQASVVADSTGNTTVTNGLFCVLHSVSLQCFALINQSHAWDERWITGLREQTRGVQRLQLPSGWSSMVERARGVLTLFQNAWTDGVWFRWMASCTYISAMVVLIVNDTMDISHSKSHLDGQRIDVALEWLDSRIREGQRKEVETLRDICAEAVEQVRQKREEILGIREEQLDAGLATLLFYNA